MPPSIVIASSFTLENWNDTTPWITGIGGSETSHIEMAQRLKRSYNVISYAPINKPYRDHHGVPWKRIEDVSTKSPGVYIWYRDPDKFDLPKGRKQKWWFVAQDVDYEGRWSEERLSKVDRYICLCKDHAAFTAAKYPSLKGRIYISSNGIRSTYIRSKSWTYDADIRRDPNQLFFPSSPDRGIKFLLENWFRVREINPKAHIKIAYGFNNMETIVRAIGPTDWRAGYQKELEALIKQPGIEFIGRQPQGKIYELWRASNIWSHPTDFPETSCITCMEAQAMGAWPVTNNLWALKDNVAYGYMTDGIPQTSVLSRSNWFHNLESAFHNRNEKERQEMSEWALENHDWEHVVERWSTWIKEDID